MVVVVWRTKAVRQSVTFSHEYRLKMMALNLECLSLFLSLPFFTFNIFPYHSLFMPLCLDSILSGVSDRYHWYHLVCHVRYHWNIWVDRGFIFVPFSNFQHRNLFSRNIGERAMICFIDIFQVGVQDGKSMNISTGGYLSKQFIPQFSNRIKIIK